MNRNEIKNQIVDSLKSESEIEKIIVFGSFIKSETPNDLDIAVIQNSNDDYLLLALKYRKLIRSVSKQIAVDIIPLQNNSSNSFFNLEIAEGEIIYERRN